MTGTGFEALLADSRFREGKQILLNTLAEHQATLTGPRPPRAEMATTYAALLASWGKMRGAALYYPYLGSGLGRGPLVELGDGSVKYDFIIGIGVHFFGHGHPALVSAALESALQNTAMQGNLQQNLISEEFGRLVLEGANRRAKTLDHVFLCTSGAMANENGVKLLFQKKFPANRLLAFSGSFAGRTLAMSQVSDKPAYRQGLPDSLAVDYVPFFDEARPEESTREALSTLGTLLDRYPGKHAGMIFELIRGEGGFYPGSAAFFRALMTELRARGVGILIDEIQTFGRTPELFAFQYFGLDEFAEIVTIGKLTQACATLFRADYNPRPGLLSQTFTGATAALHVGVAVLRELFKGDFYGPGGRVERLHTYFVNRLREIAGRTELVRGPYGVGAMVAATVLDGQADTVQDFVKRLFSNGVIAFTAGANPTRVRFLLPVGGITEAEIDAALAIFEQTLLERKDT